jgi:hypothetical protein
MRIHRSTARVAAIFLASAVFFSAPGPHAQDPPRAFAPADFPPAAEVLQGHEPVSPAPAGPSLHSLWVRKKDARVLAELPASLAGRQFLLAAAVASGETYAGLPRGGILGYWRAYDKRVAFIEPFLGVRSTGDPESQSSVRRLFTDRVVLEAPVLTVGPQGGPVIELSALLIANLAKFFGPEEKVASPALASLKTLKAFPRNLELAFELPVADGRLKTFHYSLSSLEDDAGYQPRLADQRVGYFTTGFDDFGRFSEDGVRVRYVNRWRLAKRDPKLKLSPPLRPIVFHVEHTTPVRYRPWVKKGILAWNEAFEKVGIRDAIEVEQQDAVTGEHMEKDPEDVRFNFVRWLSNDVATAIGPIRVHPRTGEILDADIILTDGWIRFYLRGRGDLLPALALEALPPAARPWLALFPAWDPRGALGAAPPGAAAEPVTETCRAADGWSLDLAALAMSLAAAGDGPDTIDGMPEEYIGPLLLELTAHEVGHTLGLRHNFKASAAYSLAEINDPKRQGLPIASSVMDYLPVNFSARDGAPQGDFSMTRVGPYDVWAIEYGYSFAEDLQPILARAAEPAHAYATDHDTLGPDPLAHRYDLGSDPLDFARRQMELVQLQRQRLLERFVKPGESWAKAGRGYEATLGLQLRALSTLARRVGGALIDRELKGAAGRRPLEVVPAASQREALRFVIEMAFHDAAFGLTPELLRHLAQDPWRDEGHWHGAPAAATWPVHARVLGVQRAVLTWLLNPATLERVFDNEARTLAGVEAFSVPELLAAVSADVWSELGAPRDAGAAKRPWISSWRRNLQREHLERLIDLAGARPAGLLGALPVASLALAEVRELRGRIGDALEKKEGMDGYAAAHLAECLFRADVLLNAARGEEARREVRL